MLFGQVAALARHVFKAPFTPPVGVWGPLLHHSTPCCKDVCVKDMAASMFPVEFHLARKQMCFSGHSLFRECRNIWMPPAQRWLGLYHRSESCVAGSVCDLIYQVKWIACQRVQSISVFQILFMMHLTRWMHDTGILRPDSFTDYHVRESACIYWTEMLQRTACSEMLWTHPAYVVKNVILYGPVWSSTYMLGCVP